MTIPWIDTINVLETTKGIPVPQYYDPNDGANQPLLGQGNASSVVRGKWYQVGAGATTGSVPMVTPTGLTLVLSTASQARLVGSTVEMAIGTELIEAIVTAVSSAGTLTLDSALPSAPAQGTVFRLIPPEQTSLTGSNAINEQRYNGTTWESVNNNIQGTVLASAARTATTESSMMVNNNARGVIVFLSVTAASTTGGLSLQIATKDPVTGNNPYALTASPTAVTAIGEYGYLLYPGVSTAQAAIKQATSGVLPRSWYVYITAGDASSYTYSVGYAYIN